MMHKMMILAALALGSLSVHAETLEQAQTKAQKRATLSWHKKQAKKAVRERIKEKYKDRLDAIKAEMNAEIEAETDALVMQELSSN